MKESYREGLATHSGPESCVIIRKGDGEALTGDMQVGLLSREIDPTPGCRRSYGKRKATLTTAQARAVEGPRAVKDLGYSQPTPIQQQAIPAVLAGGDLMAGAQTGTGKTLIAEAALYEALQ